MQGSALNKLMIRNSIYPIIFLEHALQGLENNYIHLIIKKYFNVPIKHYETFNVY